MRIKKSRSLFRRVHRFQSLGSRYEHQMDPEFEKELQEWQSLVTGMGSIQFSFRDGFSDRVTARLLNLLEKDSMRDFYYSLSSLLPKIVYSSLVVLVLILVTILVIHGQFDQNVLLGTDKIDDSNFVSYLIFQNN